MPEALVLLIVDPRIEVTVLEEIRGYPGVTEAQYIYGPYDIYIRLSQDTFQGIQYIVLDKIRQLPGVKQSVTCMIAE